MDWTGLTCAQESPDAGGKKPGEGKPKATSTISGLSVASANPTGINSPITSGGAAGTGATSNKVIAVVVGSPTLNKSLVFTPNDISAKPGDIVQFQFSQVNHTVTQSSFAEPCMPIQQSDPNAAGIHSGFVAVSANETTVQTFDVPINDTKPMFIYCAQGPHCQLGMVMTINAYVPCLLRLPSLASFGLGKSPVSFCRSISASKTQGILIVNSANGTENFAAYKAAAAKAAKNVPASNFKGGVLGNIPKADAVPPPV